MQLPAIENPLMDLSFNFLKYFIIYDWIAKHLKVNKLMESVNIKVFCSIKANVVLQ